MKLCPRLHEHQLNIMPFYFAISDLNPLLAQIFLLNSKSEALCEFLTPFEKLLT